MGVFIIIFSFFAIYGALQLIAKTVFCVRTAKIPDSVQICRVLFVKDCADSVEGIVRTLTWEDTREEIFVVDLESKDETLYILKNLEREYAYLHGMTKEDYISRVECEK